MTVKGNELMLLRSLTKHVKDQNWFAVALDFFIVVAGILIAFQISNWNEARIEKEQGREYIVRIQEDLRANQLDMAVRETYFSAIRTHALSALRARQQDRDTLDEQFLVSSFIASYSLKRSFRRGAYDELLSAGAMNSIRDVDVRNRISEFYRIADGSEYYMSKIPKYADTLRQTMPYDVQAALRNNGCNAGFATHENGEIAATVPDECSLDLSPELTQSAITRLLDADLEPDLTRALADFDLKLQNFQVWRQRAQDLHDYLEEAK